MSREVDTGREADTGGRAASGGSTTASSRNVVLALVALLVCPLVASAAVYFASSHPDGLEAVAEEQGFAESAEDSATAELPFADYGEGASVNGLLVGALGLAATGVVAFGGFWLLAHRRPPES